MSPEDPWPKSCGCGETWSEAEWAELPLVGHYLAGRDGWIELRTCVCGSTMVIEATRERTAEPTASATA